MGKWILVILIFFSQKTVFSDDLIISNELTSKQFGSFDNISSGDAFAAVLGSTTLSGIGFFAGVFTIYSFLRNELDPSTTPQETLELVKRLTDALRPDVEGQFKAAEDTISRALHDMTTMTVDNPSEFQRTLWLERTRLLDGDVILLLEGLLGQQVAGGDLMENIKDKLECDAVKIFRELNRYNDLITGGTLAFNFFSSLSGMSELETNLRRAAFRERNFRVLQRNEDIIEQCFQSQLSDFSFNNEIDEEGGPYSTDQVAEQVAEAMSNFYPLPTRWIVAVYTDDRNTISRAAVKPIKPKLSASYNVKDINGYHVAIFPFFEGENPRMVNGQLVDEFCNRPVTAAGKMPQCNVGSSDGEYVYDELRRQGIVPNNFDLIVVPSEGKLSIRTVPLGSLSPFFAKNYPDFDIVIF